MDSEEHKVVIEPNRSLHISVKSEAEKTNDIIHNVLTMLSNRVYFEKSGTKKNLIEKGETRKSLEDKGLFEDKGNNTFTVKVTNGDHYVFKIVYDKITAVGKQSVINDFFKDYAQYKKILIAQEYNKKIHDYVAKNHTQIFLVSAFLQDIISHRDQPEFEILSPKEIEAVKTEYNINEYTTKKYMRSDPVVRYFGLKKGDIVRIIRPSIISGKAIDYRIVV